MCKFILVGPLPPPYHGQSLSFKMLVDSMRKDFSVDVVNLVDKQIDGRRGLLRTLTRAFNYIAILADYTRKLLKGKCRVYITVAQSRQGFVRDFFMIWIAVFLCRPVVVHLKGGNYDNFYAQQSPWLKFFIRKTLLKVERILVLGKRLVHMYDFEPALRDRIFVVENGLPIDIELVEPKQYHDERVELLFLSNMVESKGYFDILNAVALLKSSEIDFHVHFAGGFYVNADDVLISSEKQAKSLFYKKIEELGIADRITYHGIVSGQDKINLLKRCHVFLLPTNYNNEGQPVSIIESLAFGLPIVATDYRAISDMVLDKKTGVFVEYHRPEQISNALQFITDKENYTVMSKNCIELYSDKFTREAHLNRIIPHILGDS